MRIKSLIIIMSLLALPVVAGASPGFYETQEVRFCGIPNFTETLTFNQFDDMGGTRTLQSIEVYLELNVDHGTFILDNDGELPASGTFEFGAKGSLSSTDVDLLDMSLQPVISEVQSLHSQAFDLDGNIGDGQFDFDPAAPDGLEYNGTLVSNWESGYINPTLFSQYIGMDTFDLDVFIEQWSEFGGVSGIEWAVTPVDSCGRAIVEYCYTPEPSTIVALALGTIFLRRRRSSISKC